MDHPIPIFLSPDARIEPVTATEILRRSAHDVEGLTVVDREEERGIDPTIAVAAISGLVSIITAALPALIQIWSREKKRSGRVVLALDDDSKIEFETGADSKQPDNVDALLAGIGRKIVAIYLA